MKKTKEELKSIKDELVTFSTKLQELDDEEIETIVGGNTNDLSSKKEIDFDLIPAPGSRPDITKRIVAGVLRSVFNESPGTSTFKDEDMQDSKSEFELDKSDQSVFKD